MPLVRARAEREALLATFAAVAAGNALAFVEPNRRERPAAKGARGAGRRGGGRRGRGPPGRGAPRGRHGALDRGARGGARYLASSTAPPRRWRARSGHSSARATSTGVARAASRSRSWSKLAVYRLDAPVRAEDVDALVADAVPGSTWAFADAVGARRAREATEPARPPPRDDAGAGAGRDPPPASPGDPDGRGSPRAGRHDPGDRTGAQAQGVPCPQALGAGHGVAAGRARRGAGGSPRARRDAQGRARPTRDDDGWPSRCGSRSAWRGSDMRRRDGRRLGCPPGGPQSALDQACSWTTRSDSIAKTQRARPRWRTLDQLGVDVELVAVLAEAGRDREAEALRRPRPSGSRVETRDDEAAGALGASIAQARHRGFRTSDCRTDPLGRARIVGAAGGRRRWVARTVRWRRSSPTRSSDRATGRAVYRTRRIVRASAHSRSSA